MIQVTGLELALVLPLKVKLEFFVPFGEGVRLTINIQFIY